MFPFRHAAARLLSSRSVAIAARPRTIASFTSVHARQSRIVAPSQFARRWQSTEAEAKKEEVPISELQPTPQEEVENAIHEDRAVAGTEAAPAQSQDAPAIAETANASEATEEVTSTATEPESVQQAIDHIGVGEAAQEVTRNVSSSAGRDTMRAPREPPTPKNSIYVGNLFFDVTENDLQKEFGRFGEISSVRLVRDARGLSKGFGYLTYATTEEASAAVEAMHQQLFEGRRLMVSFAYHDGPKPRDRQRSGEGQPANPPSKTLFIGNMSFEMTDRDLNNLFRGIRNVIDVRVAIDRKTGQPRGFAHADFIDIKSASEALKILNTKENYGRQLRVDFSYGPSAAPRNVPR